MTLMCQFVLDISWCVFVCQYKQADPIPVLQKGMSPAKTWLENFNEPCIHRSRSFTLLAVQYILTTNVLSYLNTLQACCSWPTNDRISFCGILSTCDC